MKIKIGEYVAINNKVYLAAQSYDMTRMQPFFTFYYYTIKRTATEQYREFSSMAVNRDYTFKIVTREENPEYWL